MFWAPVALLLGKVRNLSRLTDRALGNQVRIDEGEMAELILGIVVDILGHVPIQTVSALI